MKTFIIPITKKPVPLAWGPIRRSLVLTAGGKTWRHTVVPTRHTSPEQSKDYMQARCGGHQGRRGQRQDGAVETANEAGGHWYAAWLPSKEGLVSSGLPPSESSAKCVSVSNTHTHTHTHTLVRTGLKHSMPSTGRTGKFRFLGKSTGGLQETITVSAADPVDGVSWVTGLQHGVRTLFAFHHWCQLYYF